MIENVDPVTNLYNVYEFLNYMKKVQNEATPVDILMLGITGFHLINDTYGYDNANSQGFSAVAARAGRRG